MSEKYKMIQVPAEAYYELKEYCNKHNKKLGREVADMITKCIGSPSKNPKKVLKVDG